MTHHLAVELGFWMASIGCSYAHNITATDYGELKSQLLGQFDLETLAAPDMPGQLLYSALRYPGLDVGNGLYGQRSFRVGIGDLAASRLAGRPDERPEVSKKIARHQRLAIAAISNPDTNPTNVVFSTTFTPTDSDFLYNHGSGTLALGFSDRQFTIGFRLEFLQPVGLGDYQVRVRFFDETGTWINASPIQITKPGFYGFETISGKRTNVGLSITNFGAAGVVIDDIIYEIPPLIGHLGTDAIPT